MEGTAVCSGSTYLQQAAFVTSMIVPYGCAFK
jgi:hypothetical protein